MLCEVCKKNQATVFITKVENGNKQQVNLCEHCAKEFNGLSIGEGMGMVSPFSFQNILSGLLDYIGETPQTSKYTEVACKNCGTTLSDFKEKGILGCSECYKNLSDTVNPVINRVQGNIEHVGKIPKKSGKGISERKTLNSLKQELQKAIALEEYEKAANLRDRIRDVQNNKDNSGNVE